MFEIVIATAFGLEAITKEELKKMGYDTLTTENGRITLNGELSDVCRLNINLRTANRVFIVLDKFFAKTFDELFEGIYKIEWQDILLPDAKIYVTGKSEKSKLYSISSCQAITKKAIIEKLKKKYNVNWFEETGQLYKIEISIYKDMVYVLLDTTGDSLHKRGYRRLASVAPLKENIAAAIVILSRWREQEEVLWDPFCGSGTIPIEAALIAKNIATGLSRTFLSEENGFISKDFWKTTRLEALEKIDFNKKFRILASDIDEKMIEIAKLNAKTAGVDKDINFFKEDAKKIKKKFDKGIIVTNPPYGERLNEANIFELYSQFGRCLKSFDNWRFFILSGYDRFEKAFGKKSDRNRKIYNGKIKTYLYFYF